MENKTSGTISSLLRTYPLYWVYGKVRTFIQPYIDDTFDATEIIDNLWVGSISSPSNLQNMKSHKIKMIVNAHVGAYPLFPYDFEYKLVELLDIDTENIINKFDQILPEIHRVVESGSGVLVHCMVGASRSATIIAAYLIKYHKMTSESALEHMKRLRPVVDPNGGFVKQLKIYEEYINREL